MDQVNFLNLEYFFNLIAEFFIELFNPGSGTGERLGEAASVLGFLIRVVLPFAIIIVIGFLIYYALQVERIHAEEHNSLLDRIYRRQHADMNAEKNERWEHVVDLFSSDNVSDWRVAIIEADSMLDDLVTRLGYTGANLGEKLKSIEQANFPTLQQAWDAHKIRNRIAHEGVDFQLDNLEKNRVFKLYESVFTDAGFI